MRETKLFQVPIGDWSNDGHGKCETFYVEANYSVGEMRQAYKDTCKKIGLQMNHNTDYTGLGDCSWGENRWRNLLTDYEQSSIDERAVDILLESGYVFTMCDSFDEDDNLIKGEIYFDSDSVFHLFMWFISYSLPSDFEYKRFNLQAETINDGWGEDGLSHHIGYGVFY